jgi:hypothetical protein
MLLFQIQKRDKLRIPISIRTQHSGFQVTDSLVSDQILICFETRGAGEVMRGLKTATWACIGLLVAAEIFARTPLSTSLKGGIDEVAILKERKEQTAGPAKELPGVRPFPSYYDLELGAKPAAPGSPPAAPAGAARTSPPPAPPSSPTPAPAASSSPSPAPAPAAAPPRAAAPPAQAASSPAPAPAASSPQGRASSP